MSAIFGRFEIAHRHTFGMENFGTAVCRMAIAALLTALPLLVAAQEMSVHLSNENMDLHWNQDWEHVISFPTHSDRAGGLFWVSHVAAILTFPSWNTGTGTNQSASR